MARRASSPSGTSTAYGRGRRRRRWGRWAGGCTGPCRWWRRSRRRRRRRRSTGGAGCPSCRTRRWCPGELEEHAVVAADVGAVHQALALLLAAVSASRAQRAAAPSRGRTIPVSIRNAISVKSAEPGADQGDVSRLRAGRRRSDGSCGPSAPTARKPMARQDSSPAIARCSDRRVTHAVRADGPRPPRSRRPGRRRRRPRGGSSPRPTGTAPPARRPRRRRPPPPRRPSAPRTGGRTWAAMRSSSPSRSWRTSTWPSQSGPAPMPMVGTGTDRVIAAATSRGTHSSTMAKQPALGQGHGVVDQGLRPPPPAGPGPGSRPWRAPTGA